MGRMEVEEVVSVVESCLAVIRWRLRPPSKRRLVTDILALYTGLRPVVMVDYGGKMPELQEHLCALMLLAHKESCLLLPLRVMIIEDMIYIIHVTELAEHARPTTARPLCVKLEQEPLKILLQSDENAVVEELVLIQKLFSSIFPVREVNPHPFSDMPSSSSEPKTDVLKSRADGLSCQFVNGMVKEHVLIDFSCHLKDTRIAMPTLTGWLLGYPVVYLFTKDHAANAILTLSAKSFHLYKILVSRKKSTGEHLEDLLLRWIPAQLILQFCTFRSDIIHVEFGLAIFTVPYDLSMRGKDEPWARAFLARMMEKFRRCKPAWDSLRLEVVECNPQAIVL